MTPFSRGAQAMRHDRGPHINRGRTFDGQQRIGRTGGDARKILAQIARSVIRENDRRAVLLMKHDGAVRTGFDAIIALRATIEKQRFLDRSGRTQPVGPHGRRGRLGNRLGMLGKLLRGFRDGQDGILEKIPPPVFRIRGHDNRRCVLCRWSKGLPARPQRAKGRDVLFLVR